MRCHLEAEAESTKLVLGVVAVELKLKIAGGIAPTPVPFSPAGPAVRPLAREQRVMGTGTDVGIIRRRVHLGFSCQI